MLPYLTTWIASVTLNLVAGGVTTSMYTSCTMCLVHVLTYTSILAFLWQASWCGG